MRRDGRFFAEPPNARVQIHEDLYKSEWYDNALDSISASDIILPMLF